MTDDDRKLLERAARAAGLYEDWPAPDYEVQWNGDGMWCCGMGRGYLWNPLTDDGDALRLAVRCGIAVYPPEDPLDDATAHVDGPGSCWISEPVLDGDPCAATRRAIVLAASGLAP